MAVAGEQNLFSDAAVGGEIEDTSAGGGLVGADARNRRDSRTRVRQRRRNGRRYTRRKYHRRLGSTPRRVR